MFSRQIWEPATLAELLLTTPLHLFITTVYKLLNTLHSSPGPKTTDPIRVVCISDTHTVTCALPPGDILIHAGDLANKGSVAEIQAQIDWLDSLPHQHKIAIAGNHDAYLDPRSRMTLTEAECAGALDWKSIRYLQHTGATLTVARGEKSRSLTVYGAPQIPKCGGPNFAFQYLKDQDAWSGTVPEKVDILVTHTPAKFHLDLYAPSLGCSFLLKELWRVKPRLHVFGHIHHAAGREVLRWDDTQRIYESCLANGRKGLVAQVCSLRLWFGALKIVWIGFSGLVWDWIWGGEWEQRTVVVNAALMEGHSGRLDNKVQVVDL